MQKTSTLLYFHMGVTFVLRHRRVEVGAERDTKILGWNPS